MTPKEISQIIEKEINGDWSISNWHGCDLKKCLIRPTKRVYYDGLDNSVKHEFWLVLEELPETLDGYKVVFDEEKQLFGLAASGVATDYFLGFYGTFLDAYKAM